MSTTPWVKWYAADFLNGISDLEPSEIALYTVVLNLVYDHGGAIPDDVVKIARRCNMRPTSAEKALRTLVEAGKLVRFDGQISNARAEKEIESRRKVVEKSTESARSRWEKRGGKPNEINETPMHSQCERNATAYAIQNQNQNREEKIANAISVDEAFSRFWAAYPRRDGANPKKPALDKFARKIRDGTDPEAIIRGAEAYARSMAGRDPQYVAQAVTWLNQDRWNDDHAEPNPTGVRPGSVDGRANRPASSDSVFYATLARRAAESGPGGWPSDADGADPVSDPRGFAGSAGSAEVVSIGARGASDGSGRGWTLALDAPPSGRRDFRGGFG